MSDLFYPEIVAGDKYNAMILMLIPQLRYSVSNRTDEPMGLLWEAIPPSATPTLKCKFPRRYIVHLERFLWRYYLLFALYDHFHLKCSALNRLGTGFLQRMLVMMDTVLEQLVVNCSRLGNELDANANISYFDYYLVTEFVVGRHDPENVDAWRRHPDNAARCDLERISPDSLDWDQYDTALGDLLGGRLYQHTLSAVKGAADWHRLLEAVSQWYGLSFQTSTKEKRTKKVRLERLVQGSAGLGFVPISDDERDAEGDTDPETVSIQADMGNGKGKDNEKMKEQSGDTGKGMDIRREREQQEQQDEKMEGGGCGGEKTQLREETGAEMQQMGTEKEKDVTVDIELELARPVGLQDPNGPSMPVQQVAASTHSKSTGSTSQLANQRV